MPLPCARELLSQPARASPMRTQKIGLISMAGCWWTVMTWRSWGRRYLFTEAGTVSVFGTSLIPVPTSRFEAGDEVSAAGGCRGLERPEVVREARRNRLLGSQLTQ